MAKKKDNTFLLVSLEETKARTLAKVINNDVCRRVLELLSHGSLTETEIAEKLNIPLSTAHYNIQQLVESELVSAEEYHYSEKGKEVNHYSLANKYVIIAPKVTEGLAQKLSKILPIVGLSIVTAGLLQLLVKQPMQITRTITNTITQIQPVFAEKTLSAGAAQAGDIAHYESAAIQLALGNATTNTTISMAVQQSQYFNPAAWFLVGALTAVVLFLLVEAIREKFNK